MHNTSDLIVKGLHLLQDREHYRALGMPAQRALTACYVRWISTGEHPITAAAMSILCEFKGTY